MTNVEPQNRLSDDLIYPVRWVLGDEIELYFIDPETGGLGKPLRKHCDACLKFAGEYENYQAMLAITSGAVPGYFPDHAIHGEDDQDYGMDSGEYDGIACGGYCTCHLEMFIDSKWVRI